MERTWPTITLTDRLAVCSSARVAPPGRAESRLANTGVVAAQRLSQPAHGRCELVHGVDHLGRHGVGELDGPDRRPRERAHVADRGVEPGQRLAVALDGRPRRAAPRRDPGGLGGNLERIAQPGLEPGDVAAGQQRAPHGVGIARAERHRHVVEHRPEVGQQRLERPAGGGHGVDRQQHGVDRDPDRPADQRIDEPLAALRLQGRDQHGRGRRLVDQQRASPEGHRRAHGQHDDQGELHAPRADHVHEQVRDQDAERDAQPDLDGPARAPPGPNPDDDHRGDRSEERPRVADEVPRDDPGDRGRQRALEDRNSGMAEAQAHGGDLRLRCRRCRARSSSAAGVSPSRPGSATSRSPTRSAPPATIVWR